MAGKVVSVGAVGSATEVRGAAHHRGRRNRPDLGIQRRQLGAAETVAALRDGTVDAGFWSGGLPTGAMVDLAGDGDMKLLPTGEYADPLAQKYGAYYFKQDIPANTYEGQNEAVPAIASPNILVASKKMDESFSRTSPPPSSRTRSRWSRSIPRPGRWIRPTRGRSLSWRPAPARRPTSTRPEASDPMPKPAAAVVGLVCLGMLGAGGIAVAGAPAESHGPRALVISNDGGVLASMPPFRGHLRGGLPQLHLRHPR